MRTKGVYLSVTVGGTLDSGQLCAAAIAAKALRGAGLTVLALDAMGRLLDEKAALAAAPDRGVPVLVAVRGDVMTRHRWKKAGGRRPPAPSPVARMVALAGSGPRADRSRRKPEAEGGGHGKG